jgi:hypothetical protein
MREILIGIICYSIQSSILTCALVYSNLSWYHILIVLICTLIIEINGSYKRL